MDKDFASLKSNPIFSAALANIDFMKFIASLDLTKVTDTKYKLFMESIFAKAAENIGLDFNEAKSLSIKKNFKPFKQGFQSN